jgi:hypothetical protein
MFICTPTPISSRGMSDTASLILEKREDGCRQIQNSYFLKFRSNDVRAALENVARESSRENWDGYGASAVKTETIQQTLKLLNGLPLGISTPSVGVEPDGQLTLEWYRSPRHVLSVSVTPDGNLHYAAISGLRTSYGTEPFFDAIPRAIISLIFEIQQPVHTGAA